jgi:membrane protein implicated in regulation of membrane protease activity
MDVLQQYGWLIVLVLAIVVEAVSLGLTSVWFAFGALAAWLLSLVVDSFAIQLMVFLLVSLALLIGIRPFAVKTLKIGRHRTNADALVGQEGFVLKPIEPLTATGQVKVRSQIWTAVSEQSLDEGEKVTVQGIQGVKLIVKRAEEEEK